ncbi:MAG: RnfABCDGE type electron transport complex subunit D [Myxococcota bacterium]
MIQALVSDPRHGQIAMLASLWIYGQLALGFAIRPDLALAIAGSALATQLLCDRFVARRAFDPRSALVTSLSLCLLLRTDTPAWALAAGAVAVGSKFALRRDGKHVFNPANFALVAGVLVTDRVWVSPGQWGHAAWLAFAVAGLGFVIVRRAERSDVTWAFLAVHAGLLFGRAWWLGDPWSIPLHQLHNGALLIFAFFMISDPRTTPDSRPGRIGHAAVVAGVAMWIRFGLWEPNALLYALVACAPLVPLFDRVWPGPRHAWPARTTATRGETFHAPSPSSVPAPGWLARLRRPRRAVAHARSG